MNYSSISLFVLCFFQSFIYAQTENFTIGDSYPTPIEGSFLRQDKQLFVINSTAIQIFNTETLKKTKDISIQNVSKGTTSLAVKKLGEKYYWFYYIEEKKIKNLYYKSLDLETGTTGKEDNLIGSISSKLLPEKEYLKNGYNQYDFFKIKTTADGSKLIVSTLKQTHVFDSNMKLIWKCDDTWAELKPTETDYATLDEIVTNDGVYYALIKIYKDDTRDEVVDGKTNYNIVLIKRNGDEKKKVIVKELNNKFIDNLVFHQTLKNELLCIGYYIKGFDHDLASGYISMSIEDVAFNNIIINEIPAEIIHQKDKKIPSTPGALGLFGLNIINSPNGNMLLIDELSIYFNGSNYIGGELEGAGEILISEITSQGDLVWMNRVFKRQTHNGLNPGCDSYKYIYLNNKHYLIFMDNPQNEDLTMTKDGKACHFCDNGYIRAYTFSNEGKVGKENILDLDEHSSTPAYNYKASLTVISDTEFVFKLLRNKKKEEGFVKIKVK